MEGDDKEKCAVTASITTRISLSRQRLYRLFAGVFVLFSLAACAHCEKQSVEIHKDRYQKIWDSVKNEGEAVTPVPSLVAHLGAIAGNSAAIWVRINDDSKRISKDAAWSLVCNGRAVSITPTIFDRDYSTARLEVPLEEIGKEGELCTVSMENKGNAKYSADVRLPPAATLSESEEFFSFAAFSCNEPFHAGHGGGVLARDLSLWQRLHMRTKGEKSRDGVLPERPSFVLGLGDQVYVDPDPDVRDGLALFYGSKSDKSDYPASSEDYRKLLDSVYRYNFSMPTLVNALNGIPSYMMWDDHEIRDGWGSHGDEGKDNWPLYFREARHAFIANQYMRMLPTGQNNQNEYDKLIKSEEALHFLKPNIKKGVHLLMLDGRSRRSQRGLYDKDAQKFVGDWLKSGKDYVSDLFILTVGVPLFPSRYGESGTSSGPCMDFCDDLDDSWGSKRNDDARKGLLSALKAYFQNNHEDRLLVLSGDVHQSALFFIKLNSKVIGHEIVTSGVANVVSEGVAKVTTLVDVAKDIESFSVIPAGKISNSATFAEVVVDRRTVSKPKLSVVYHLNGADVGYRYKGTRVIANTNLLSEVDGREHYYFPYKFRFQNQSAHLDVKLQNHEVGAGAIVDLPYEKPDLRCHPLNGNVLSVIQTQGAFCSVSSAKYDSALAKSWNLGELNNCKPLTHGQQQNNEGEGGEATFD